jgi:nicotinamide-nucleotide amidase
MNEADEADEASEVAPPADAAAVVAALAARRRTVATAESLTGGLLGVALTAVPGASAVYRGGVVAYATDLKAALLGVDAALLAAVGAVDPEVARQMARGARARLAATYGVATTGVAGPDPHDGHPVGTVHVAVSSQRGERVRDVAATGGRAEIRAAAVRAALDLLAGELARDTGNPES